MDAQATDRERVERRWRRAALILGAIVLSLGCSPLTIISFLWPDNKTQPSCPIAAEDNKKEVTLLVLASFSTIPLESEIMSADQELAERLIEELKKRFKEEGLKVKVIPHYLVQNYKNKTEFPESPYDVGKHFKADKVLSLEVGRLTLYKEKSFKQLFHGRAEISLVVTDVSEPPEASRRWSKEYVSVYPRTGEIPAGDSNPAQFRALFLDHVAKDMTHYFTPYDVVDRVGLGEAESDD
jgi:hypothetical protein